MVGVGVTNPLADVYQRKRCTDEQMPRMFQSFWKKEIEDSSVKVFFKTLLQCKLIDAKLLANAFQWVRL